MIVHYDDGRDEPKIEDIIQPTAVPYINVGEPHVKHMAIGHLDEQYLRSRLSVSRAATASADTQVIEGVTGRALASYTRIPPLADLSLPRLASPREIWRERTGVITLLAGALVAVGSGLRYLIGDATALLKRHWLPKRYLAAVGLTIDWRARGFFFAKYSLPLIAALLCLLIGVLAWPLRTHQPRGATHHTRSTTATTTNLVEQSGSNPQASNGAALPGSNTAPTSSVQGSSAANQPGQPGTSRTTNSGATGSSPNTVNVPVPAPNLPYTISLPPTNVQGAGKPLLNTSGSTIGIN